MEDEDNENGLVDTWSLWEETYRDVEIESLAEINNSSVCLDEIEQNREHCFYSAYSFESDGNDNSEASLKNVIKGLKKNILKPAKKNEANLFDLSLQQLEQTHDTAKKQNKAVKVKTEKMTEYTQYLGLQPALSKPECSKCNSSANNFTSESNLNQCNCLSIMTSFREHTSSFELPPNSNSEFSFTSNSDFPSTSISKTSPSICKFQSVGNKKCQNNSELPSTDSYELSSSSAELPCNSYELLGSNNSEVPVSCTTDLSSNINSEILPISQASNFKITRKVYLCAACETYFENWNLFLHMREVHKRHICLFCLGMFGQAERLSRHLTKKHIIPEIAFHSVEEFYKNFKGSCYIVCCSCEKIFSETDNFYNHFCYPQQNQQSNSELCSLCRQIGTHMKTCSLATERNKRSRGQQSLNISKIHAIDSFASSPNMAGIRRCSKRIIKPNRLNDDVYLYTKLTNIRAKRNKLHNTMEINETIKNIASEYRSNKFNKSIVESGEILQDSIRDTVAETIMEVSKCGEDSDSLHSNKYISNEFYDSNNKSISKIKSLNDAKNIYDSVTETIMEVSCYMNNSNNTSYMDKTISNKNSAVNVLDCSINNSIVESPYPQNEENVRLNDVINKSIETKDIGIENNLFDNPHTDFNSNFGSQTSNSSNSPINRSVFSPSCEAQEIITKNGKNLIKSEMESKSVPIITPVTSITDRSLVIKICTKNNSIFSIKTPTLNKNNTENHERCRESEENNNGQISSNKILIIEQNDNINNQLYTNEQDNDTNSNKLAIVNSSKDEQIINNSTIVSDNNKENKFDTAQNNVINQQEKKIEELVILQDKNKIDTVINNIENPDGILLAGEEIPVIDLNVDDLLESMEIEDLLKRCVKAVCSVCVYCNHVRHIAVNGKQLSLHMLAEHRFQPQHPAIIIHQEQFTTKVKKCLKDLESYYFNLDSYNSKKGTYNILTVKVYECFLCRYCTTAHKELYLHNRKMHQKPILICIMCKSTFCSYSELLCHLCPGVYAANVNIQYRCCLCSLTNLPSTFRLMVHLRKQHHACDVCLECTSNQQRLSNHVWKHKLHHLCYRCGIAYRNKPDITKHLFWKHGTESVLCKKCLQKKWPHIYHFCIPPTAFSCEECGFSFSKAVALKVHKRIHTSDFPYSCSECLDKFISKKLLFKHEKSHKEPPCEITSSIVNSNSATAKEVGVHVCNIKNNKEISLEVTSEVLSKETIKKVIDVYDLPPLNLSSDSDSESEDNKVNEKSDKITEELNNKTEILFDSKVTIDLNSDIIVEVERNEEEKKQEEQIMDGIWDNFKSYTARLEKQDSSTKIAIESDSIKFQEQGNLECKENKNSKILRNIVLVDHDYCVIYSDKVGESCNKSLLSINDNARINDSELKLTCISSFTHKQNMENDYTKKKIKSKKKKQNVSTSSSESSSDSDSSSCSCRTNCSCSSSSSSTSSTSTSSSDSESSVSTSLPQKTNLIREKHKKEENIEDIKTNSKETLVKKENGAMEKIESLGSMNQQLIIIESDLDTTETETDEDFYDEQPQQLANKLLAEKRNRLMILANIAPISIDSNTSIPVNNGVIDINTRIHSSAPSTPAYTSEKTSLKKKMKTKKHKKDVCERDDNSTKIVESIKLNIPKLIYQTKSFISKPPSVKSHSISNFDTNQSIFEINQMVASESLSSVRISQNIGGNSSEADAKRSSKRKRVPKRFYGDSSDEENHKQMLKWRRIGVPSPVKTQLPSTSKNTTHRQCLQNYQQSLLQKQQQQLQFKQERLLQEQRYQNKQEKEPEDEKTLVITASGSDSNELIDSNSESSDSDNKNKNKGTNIISRAQIHYSQFHPPNLERANNLYCYCQCPYDEVSEMIACDGDNCQIEWFHFECVGIMVPPKGKWYCPDCRRKLGIPDDVED